MAWLLTLLASTFALFANGLATAQVAVTPWLIRVHDIETNAPLVGVVVKAPELEGSRVAGVVHKAITSNDGEATLYVPQGALGVAVFAEGTSTHHYAVKNGDVEVPLRVFMAPYAAFHKTFLIPVSGTVAPIVFSGTRPSPLGTHSYRFELSVPPGVLRAPSQIWIYPRPLWAASRSLHADCSPGEFHIELRDATGLIAVRQRVGDAGLTLQFTPFWLPAAMFPVADQVIVDTRNMTTMGWDRDKGVGTWDPGTGMVTLNLNHFSGQECAFWSGLLRNLGFDTSSPLAPKPPFQPAAPSPPQVPPSPLSLVRIERSTCVKVAGIKSAGTIDCGTYIGGAASAGATAGGSVTVSQNFTAEASAKLNVGASGISNLLAKLEAETSFKFSSSTTGALSLSWAASAGKTWSQGDKLASKYKCYSGDLYVFATERTVSLVSPVGTISIGVPDVVTSYVCLDFDPSCAGCTQEPGAGQAGHIAICIPESIALCSGQAPCN